MTAKSKVSQEYLNLIHRFPLRPIRDRRTLKEASILFSELGMKGLNLRSEEEDYLMVLGNLIRQYEVAHSVLLKKSISPQRALKSLMEDNGLSQSELARKIGTQQSIISEFLSGRRGLSKEVALSLSQFFCVKPEFFMQSRKSTKVS